VRYACAATLDEALEALGAGARPVAGGSDLVVAARQGKTPLPDFVVAIDRMDGPLRGIRAEAGGVCIGALARHADIEAAGLIRRAGLAALADGSALIGSPATRNVGTLGGNVMNASPAMDTGPALLAFDAEVELRSSAGARRLRVAELWRGPGVTTARSDELCVAIHIPEPDPRAGSAYVRLEYRRAMEIAVVGAAATVTLGDDGTVEECRITLAAVAPTVIRAPTAERALAGCAPSEEALAAVAAGAGADARPISDLRGSDRYRRHTAGVMARRAVEFAIRRAQGEDVEIPCNRAHRIGLALGDAS
jgi:CO/xanthine dehydrogenase FAD-binding subunit